MPSDNEEQPVDAKTIAELTEQTTLAPVRQYLQASVVPVLLAGLTELASSQPADPVAWLGQYLIDNNPRNKKEEGEGGDGGDEKMEEEEAKDKEKSK